MKAVIAPHRLSSLETRVVFRVVDLQNTERRSIMLNRKVVKGMLSSLLLLLVGLLLVWAIFTGLGARVLGHEGPASAESSGRASALSLAVPDDVYQCSSVGVAVYPERIHVECGVAAPGGIRFFALSTGNSPHAARILSVLSMAHVTGKDLYIGYDPNDTSGTTIGCQDTDCRLIQSAAILP
jgi:hypothetical protein